MEIKGTAVSSLPLFIDSKFGKQGLEEWLDSLPEETSKVFRFNILAGKWYPINEFLKVPTKKICDLFYNGDLKGAVESGRFSAEHGLKGVLKIFVKMGSPSFIVSRASSVLPAYYKPSKMETLNNDKNNAVVRITEFPEIDEMVEHRIKGWIEKALEIQGCSSTSVKIVESMAKGKSHTRFDVSWS
jgi:hypothetical protein